MQAGGDRERYPEYLDMFFASFFEHESTATLMKRFDIQNIDLFHQRIRRAKLAILYHASLALENLLKESVPAIQRKTQEPI